MIIYYLIAFVLGLIALVGGSDLLVRKSEFLARYFKVDPIILGILLLGMGTSAPEWAVSAISATRGLSDLAMANVIGSNIFNILVVLGVILLQPITPASQTLIKKDLLFLVGAAFLIFPLFMDQYLSRLDGFLLAIIFLVYVFICIYYSKPYLLQASNNHVGNCSDSSRSANADSPQASFSQKHQSTPHMKQDSGHLLHVGFLVFLAFVLLIGGSYITVYGAEHMGEYFGVSQRIMGILMVSVGTSLPEFFTCLSAFLKGHKNMAIGNIIGSNIFNTYAVLSTASLILPADTPEQMLGLDIPVMLLSYLLILVLIFHRAYQAFKGVLPYLFFSLYALYVLGLLLFSASF